MPLRYVHTCISIRYTPPFHRRFVTRWILRSRRGAALNSPSLSPSSRSTVTIELSLEPGHQRSRASDELWPWGLPCLHSTTAESGCSWERLLDSNQERLDNHHHPPHTTLTFLAVERCNRRQIPVRLLVGKGYTSPPPLSARSDVAGGIQWRFGVNSLTRSSGVPMPAPCGTLHEETFSIRRSGAHFGRGRY